MRITRAIFLVFFMVFSCTAFAFSEEPGKDHPLLSRYPGSVIKHYQQKDFDSFYILSRPSASESTDITLQNSEKLQVEGKVTKIQYAIPKGKSAYEVFKNYELAIEKAGFEVLCRGRAKGIRAFLDHECGFWDLSVYTSEDPKDHFYLAAQSPAKDVFVSVYVGEGYSGRPRLLLWA